MIKLFRSGQDGQLQGCIADDERLAVNVYHPLGPDEFISMRFKVFFQGSLASKVMHVGNLHGFEFVGAVNGFRVKILCY